MPDRPGGGTRALQPLVAFALAALLFGYLEWLNPGLVGTDGYYHIAVAHILWQQGVHFSFPYLTMTLLDPDHYVDMHMLYHLLQAPFTALFDLATAAKLSCTLFAATACALFVWLLQRHRVPWPLFWLLALLASASAFLYRMMMPRPPVLALIYTLLFFHFVIGRRFIAQGVVALLFTWSYKVFPILVPLALFAVVCDRVALGRIDPRPLIATGLGIALGLIVNPWFPDNIGFLWNAIRMKILTVHFHTSVGKEWYSADADYYLKHAFLPLLAYITGLLCTDRSEWRLDRARLFWFLTATMWLVLTFKSRRFIEFLAPSAILFLAFAARGWLERCAIPGYRRRHRLHRPAAVALLLVTISGWHAWGRIYETMKYANPGDAYKQCARWLIDHTPEGSRVFNVDWDDFPKLLFHDPHNSYIVGLDPDYMRLKDPELYRKWRRIARGKEHRHPAYDIVHDFGARYIFTDDGHAAFRWYADHNRFMKQRYHDDYCHVYEIVGDPVAAYRKATGDNDPDPGSD